MKTTFNTLFRVAASTGGDIVVGVLTAWEESNERQRLRQGHNNVQGIQRRKKDGM